MTSKFIYKVIRIKAGFVLIIILYNCTKGKAEKTYSKPLLLALVFVALKLFLIYLS